MFMLLLALRQCTETQNRNSVMLVTYQYNPAFKKGVLDYMPAEMFSPIKSYIEIGHLQNY